MCSSPVTDATNTPLPHSIWLLPSGCRPATKTTSPLSLRPGAPLKTGKRQVYELSGGDMTSEPVFTPRSDDASEGDGWLTAVVWRAAEDRSDMLVFEALDIAKGPIAVAELPRRVPFGFHGNWVAG